MNFRYEDEEETLCRLSQVNEALIEIAEMQESESDYETSETPEWFMDDGKIDNGLACDSESEVSETPAWFTESPIGLTPGEHKELQHEMNKASDADSEVSETPEWFTDSPIRWTQDADQLSENSEDEHMSHDRGEESVSYQDSMEATQDHDDDEHTIRFPLAPPSTPTSPSYK